MDHRWRPANAEEDRQERHWLQQIDPRQVPVHLAAIMDGNGRWARQRHLPRFMGHVRGAESTERTIRACRFLPERLAEVGVRGADQAQPIRYLTLYTLSTENQGSRPADEVSAILSLIERKLGEKIDELREMGVQMRVLGRAESLPESLRGELQRDFEMTADNQDLHLFLALNYGGRREIVDAARHLAAAAAAGRLDPDAIDETVFAQSLYAPQVPDPELVVRTGGDLRISNFLLWQVAYAELWVTATFWPDFRPWELYRAIAEYQNRDRRFGGLTDHESS